MKTQWAKLVFKALKNLLESYLSNGRPGVGLGVWLCGKLFVRDGVLENVRGLEDTL